MASNKNIVLIGFMGTGKSSTGRMLASRLGRPFVDMDEYIEKHQGMKIKDIFALHGEEYFRRCESEAVAELCERKNIVIATGGGTMKNESNAALLRKSSFVVALTADIDSILLRTSKRGERPVLDAAGNSCGDRREAIAALLESRKGIYDGADFTVDTSDLSPLQVTDGICRFLKGMGI